MAEVKGEAAAVESYTLANRGWIGQRGTSI